MRDAWLERIAPRPYNLWRGRWERGTVEPTRFIFDHELVLVTEGGCRLQVGRRELELRAGSFAIVPPGVVHATVTSPGGVVRHCVHFDWIFLPPRSRGLPLWIHPPRHPRTAHLRPAPAWIPRRLLTGKFDPRGEVPELVEEAFRRWQGTALQRASCAAVVQELLLRLLWTGSRRAGKRGRAALLADRVKEAIDDAAPGDAPIQGLLASLGFSYAHLCRLFTARFGLPPAQYRNAVRLERARQLLRDPGRTVAEAAYAAGFNDPAYFSRRFSRRHGRPPSRWRGEA